MTPAQARELLNWIDGIAVRNHRYVLEGGQRCQWSCGGCGWRTEASGEEEARTKLKSCKVRCDHIALTRHKELPMPPENFS